MIFRRTLGPKGQVVIPKDIREFLRLIEGRDVIFVVENGVVMLRGERDPEEAVKEYTSVVESKLK